MIVTPPPLCGHVLFSDATMYTGPRQPAREYVDKMLLAALQEAQSVVRSYDVKAQIVGVGYILVLNLVLHFGDHPRCRSLKFRDIDTALGSFHHGRGNFRPYDAP